MDFKVFNKLTTLMFISVVVASLPVKGKSFSLKALNSAPVSQEGLAADKVTVAMIFQPDCKWCKKQGKTLTRVSNQCDKSVEVALIGTKGNRRQLKHALKHYDDNLLAYLADREFLIEIGGYEASPTTLFYDGKGNLVAKQRGFIPQEKLASAVSILSKGSCQI